MTDLDRLRQEMDTLWGPDAYGRPATPHPRVAIAVAKDGHAVLFGPAWPCDEDRPSEAELIALCTGPAPANGIVGGPSYVFEGAPPLPRSDFRIVASDEGGGSGRRPLRPEPWGDDAEWAELLVGQLGPWAMALEGDRAVSVCYTPVASSVAAEAGVWTAPEVRGRGLAGAVTAAWARAATPVFETLFYSTGHANAASQTVARKLGLRPIGHLWQLPPRAP